MIVVAALVAVGAALAVAANTGEAPEDRLAVDSDADDPDAAGDRDDEGVFGSEAEDAAADDAGQAEPVEEEVGNVDEDLGPAKEPERVAPSEELVLPGETGLELFLRTQAGELARIDLDTGEMMVTDADRLGPPQLSVVGDKVLYEQNGSIIAIDADLEGEPDKIADGYRVLPGGNNDEAWVQQPPNPDSPLSVRRVRVDGTGGTSFGIAASNILGVHEDRLVLEQHGHISVHDPETGQGRSIGDGRALSYAGGWMAWLDCRPDLTCDLVVSSADGDEQHRVEFEPASQSPWFHALLSPSGQHLIAPVFSAPGKESAVVALSLDGTAHRLEPTGDNPQDVAWAPDGSWAFVDSPGQGVLAWRASDGETVLLDPDLDGVIGAVAVR